jgi:hypothetical protein
MGVVDIFSYKAAGVLGPTAPASLTEGSYDTLVAGNTQSPLSKRPQVLLKFKQQFSTKWLRKSTLLHNLTTLNKKARHSGIREEPFYMQLCVFADFGCP